MFISIFIPLIWVAMIVSSADTAIDTVNIIRTVTGSEPLVEYDRLRFGDPLIRTIEVGIYLIAAPPVALLNLLAIPPFRAYTITTSVFSALISLFGIVVWWLLVNLFVYLVALFSSVVSYGLSASLNRLVKSQVQAGALGGGHDRRDGGSGCCASRMVPTALSASAG
jgi:hypothetical protein